MPVSLGTFSRERRQDLGLTQEQVAERIGATVRQAEVSRLESGRIALPRRDRLTAIAAALEVSLGELLVRTEALVAEATESLVQAEQALTSLRQLLQTLQPRAEAHVKIGVVDDWETMAVFAGP
jgi:transcriptional regulator with XRE-family HTH domain